MLSVAPSSLPCATWGHAISNRNNKNKNNNSSKQQQENNSSDRTSARNGMTVKRVAIATPANVTAASQSRRCRMSRRVLGEKVLVRCFSPKLTGKILTILSTTEIGGVVTGTVYVHCPPPTVPLPPPPPPPPSVSPATPSPSPASLTRSSPSRGAGLLQTHLSTRAVPGQAHIEVGRCNSDVGGV